MLTGAAYELLPRRPESESCSRLLFLYAVPFWPCATASTVMGVNQTYSEEIGRSRPCGVRVLFLLFPDPNQKRWRTLSTRSSRLLTASSILCTEEWCQTAQIILSKHGKIDRDGSLSNGLRVFAVHGLVSLA